MMLPGPSLIHIAGLHTFVSTLRTQCAEVDVTHEHDDHQNIGDRVHHVGHLHCVAVIDQPRDQFVQHKAGTDHNQPEQKDTTPEHELLARVEPTRLDFVASQHAAALKQPVQVTHGGTAVAHELPHHDPHRL